MYRDLSGLGFWIVFGSFRGLGFRVWGWGSYGAKLAMGNDGSE